VRLIAEAFPQPRFGGHSMSKYDAIVREFLDGRTPCARVELDVHPVTAYIGLCRSIESLELFDEVLVTTRRSVVYLLRLAGRGVGDGPAA